MTTEQTQDHELLQRVDRVEKYLSQHGFTNVISMPMPKPNEDSLLIWPRRGEEIHYEDWYAPHWSGHGTYEADVGYLCKGSYQGQPCVIAFVRSPGLTMVVTIREQDDERLVEQVLKSTKGLMYRGFDGDKGGPI